LSTIFKILPVLFFVVGCQSGTIGQNDQKDDDNNNKVDDIDDKSQDFILTLEAEQGTTIGQLVDQGGMLPDPACQDAWTESPHGIPDFYWKSEAPVLPEHRKEFTLNLPQTGTYYIWVRLAASSSQGDALYVGFGADDLRRIYMPDDYALNQGWRWVNQVEGDAQRLVFTALATGNKNQRP
jgi:hypothetical protein